MLNLYEYFNLDLDLHGNAFTSFSLVRSVLHLGYHNITYSVADSGLGVFMLGASGTYDSISKTPPPLLVLRIFENSFTFTFLRRHHIRFLCYLPFARS